MNTLCISPFQYRSTHVYAQLWFRVPYVERYYDVLLSVYYTVHDFRHELIVLSLRWCCIPDLHGYSSRAMMIMTWRFLLLPIMDSEYLSCSLCRWLYWRCFDDMMMMSTTTAEYGLYRRPRQLRWSLLYDIVVMSSPMSLLMSSFFTVPPGDVVVVVVLICSVCVPVQPRADEYLLHRWWVSRLQPLTPMS